MTLLHRKGFVATYAGDAHVVGIALEQVGVGALAKLVVVHVVVLHVPRLARWVRGCGRRSQEGVAVA